MGRVGQNPATHAGDQHFGSAGIGRKQSLPERRRRARE
jgi:hypothetical protein